jgi:uncharacterized protein
MLAVVQLCIFHRKYYLTAVKIIILLLIASFFSLFSCSQEYGLEPGYQWELFQSTPEWELAKAVAKEDTIAITELLKTGKFNVNRQEPKFGRTLLMLAVGNDKLKSVKALLQNGADVHARDINDDQAIHEAAYYISLKKNAYPIMDLLLQFGANSNAVSAKGYPTVPLQGAVADSSCAELLLKHGADLYYRNSDSTYVVWTALCDYQNDNIFMARHLIVENRNLVPNPILLTFPNKIPRGIYELLNILPCNDAERCQAKEQIIRYLKKEGFPEHGTYK